jgi:Glycosyltransferase like family 2
MTLLGAFHALALIVLAAVAVQTLVNLARMPRLSAGLTLDASPPVAVLVPARNEAEQIAGCLRHWAAQDYPRFEIVVYDDDSTDATAARAASVRDPRVRVIRGGPLPAGWRGKTHACHRLRQETRAPVLVFADVDVTPAPATLRAAVAALSTLGVHALSALPRHAGAGPAVRALVALQNWAPVAFVPLWLRQSPGKVVFAVLNGQFLVLRADAYDAAGGFAAVRGSLGEDAALGRRLVAGGARVALVDGSALLVCRPYRSLRQLWAANVRNLRTAVLGSSVLLVLAVGALALVTVTPPVLLVVGALGGRGASVAMTWLPLLEIGLALLSRAASDVRAGYGLALVALHPLAILALLGMALDAARRAARGHTVDWRGRRYGVRDTAG